MNIPFISGWLERQREREAHERRLAEEKTAAALKHEESTVQAQEAQMFAKPCPVNAGGLCFRECVHFRPGRAWSFTFMEETYVDSREPRCKLWGPKR